MWNSADGARGRAILLAVTIAAGPALAACGAPPALGGALPSDDAVASAVLDAVARRDKDSLLRLALTREEFERVVWPTLLVSRPEVGMPRAYVWRDTATKSRAHLDRTLERWGGRRLRLVRLDFEGARTDHGTYSLSRKARLVVIGPEGKEVTLRLFGSIIRHQGGSKVYSYIID